MRRCCTESAVAPLSFLSSSESDPSDVSLGFAATGGESFLPLCFCIEPEDLDGEAEPRAFLARGGLAERRPFPSGLTDVSGWRATGFLGGVTDGLFTAFLGEREGEELLPEDEAERERLLRTGERLCLCLPPGGPRLGGLLRRGDILLRGLGRLRGEYDLDRERLLRVREWDRERERWRGRSRLLSFSRDLGLGSSFFTGFSTDGSFVASVTESAFATSTTTSLVEEASWMTGSGTMLSDVSGSGWG